MEIKIVKAFIFYLLQEMLPDKARFKEIINELNISLDDNENLMESFLPITYLEDTYNILHRETNIKYIGWEFGIKNNFDALGSFAYIIKHSQSFEEVFKNYIHLSDVIGIGKKKIEWSDDGHLFKIQIIVDWRWDKYAPFSAQQECEGFIAFLCACMKNLTKKEIMPLSIHFKSKKPIEPPETMTPYLPLINFNSESYSVCFDSKDMKTPIISSNPLLLKELEKYVHKINNQIKNNQVYSYEVENVLIKHYKMKFLSLNEIADKMNISPRNLQRKLKIEGTSYSKILRKVKLDIAEIYLSQDKLSMSETAFLLGFSDLAAFTHFLNNSSK